MRKCTLVLLFVSLLSVLAWSQSDPFSGDWVCTGSWEGSDPVAQNINTVLRIEKTSQDWELHQPGTSDVDLGPMPFRANGPTSLRNDFYPTLAQARKLYPGIPDSVLQE